MRAILRDLVTAPRSGSTSPRTSSDGTSSVATLFYEAEPSAPSDIKLHAGLPWGKGIPMPAATVWAKWSREALARLEKVEPLIAEDAVRETPEGRLAILAWQGDPEAKITCNPLGELRLESLTVRAFQSIDLPRTWDDPAREPDEAPHAQLRAMFERVRAALYAWGEVMDHFRPGAQA